MPEPISYDPHRFRNAAAHYTAGRPPYPPALIARTVQLCGLRAADRVLDLGCGPGLLAIAFAPYVTEVIGVDPEPEMLRHAREYAQAFPHVRFIEGSSFDLSDALGRFRLVTMGRSFHWMDRAETLRRLDTMIEPDGAVALFGDTHPDVPDNAWREPYRAVLDRYAGENRRPHRGPGWVRHEAMLLDSAFRRLESIAVIEQRRVDLETLARRALSMSSLAVAQVSQQAAELARDLAGVLKPYQADDGTLTEVVAAYALIAWRP